MKSVGSRLMFLLQKFESRKLTSLVLLSVLLLLQAYYLRNGISVMHVFGPEWRNIANSILTGNGYADPFGCHSGITAWMVPGSFLPPLLVFAIFGVSKISFLVLTLFRIICIVLSFNLVLKSKWFGKKWYNNLIFLILFLFYIYLSPKEFFEIIDDLWLNLVFSFLFIYYFGEFLDNAKKIIPLAIISFLLPITIPGMAVPFVAAIVISFVVYLIQLKSEKKLIMRQSRNIKFIHYFILGASCLLSTSIWTVRNYVVFDKFIPLKSNAAFEFYLSNIVDKDGIHSYSTWLKAHPYSDEVACARMGELGEQEWLEPYKEMEKSYKENHKEEYRKKIINRTRNAFLFSVNEHDFYESEYCNSLSENERKKLIDADLIREMKGNYYWWFCLELDENVMTDSLKQLGVYNEELMTDWKKAVKRFRYLPVKDFHQDSGIIKGLALSGLPFFSLLLLILLKDPNKRIKLYFLIIYVSYTVPYILISNQLRYQKPLMVFQAFILYLLITSYINKKDEKDFIIGS